MGSSAEKSGSSSTGNPKPTRKSKDDESRGGRKGHASPAKPAPQPQQQQPQLQSQPIAEPQVPFQHAHYPRQEPADFRPPQLDSRQPQVFYPADNHQSAQGVAHGHPIAILQRPPSKNTPPSMPSVSSSLPQQHQPSPVGSLRRYYRIQTAYPRRLVG